MSQPNGNAYDEQDRDSGERERVKRGKPRANQYFGGRRGIGRRRGSGNVTRVHRCDEPVSAARKRFNVARRLGGIAQYLTQARNRIVQAMIEINKRVSGPDLLSQLFARDYISGPLQQSSQDLQRLTLQAEAYAAFAQLTGANVQFKAIESQYARGWEGGVHRTPTK